MSITEQLINYVKENSLLFDYRDPSNKDIRAKDKKWIELAAICNKDAETLKRQWKNLKDSYSRYLKSQRTKTGQATSKYHHWQWAKHMEFLKPHLGVTGTTSNARENGSPSQNTEEDREQQPCVHSEEPTISTARTRKQYSATTTTTTTTNVDKILSYIEKRNATDAVDHLFLSWAQTIKTFSPLRLLQTKREIANIIMQQEQAQLEDDLMNQPPSLPDTRNTTTTISSTSSNNENVLYVKSECLDEPELSNESDSRLQDSEEEKTEVVVGVGLSGVNERCHSPYDDYANYNDTSESYQQMYAEKSHISFDLPPFSEYVQPYLNGTATDHQMYGMRNQLISELIDYLDTENLLVSSNTMTQSWGSRRLQRALLLQYPNIIKERSKSKDGKQRSKGELGMLMTRLLDNRRRKKKDVKRLADLAVSNYMHVEEDEELHHFLHKKCEDRPV